MLNAVSGWMNQRQLLVIDYLREENRVLREQLGGRRVRLDDNQRRRLAVKAKALGRKVLTVPGGRGIWMLRVRCQREQQRRERHNHADSALLHGTNLLLI